MNKKNLAIDHCKITRKGDLDISKSKLHAKGANCLHTTRKGAMSLIPLLNEPSSQYHSRGSFIIPNTKNASSSKIHSPFTPSLLPHTIKIPNPWQAPGSRGRRRKLVRALGGRGASRARTVDGGGSLTHVVRWWRSLVRKLRRSSHSSRGPRQVARGMYETAGATVAAMEDGVAGAVMSHVGSGSHMDEAGAIEASPEGAFDLSLQF